MTGRGVCRSLPESGQEIAMDNTEMENGFDRIVNEMQEEIVERQKALH
jgi:hypothetical protein